MPTKTVVVRVILCGVFGQSSETVKCKNATDAMQQKSE